MPRTRYHFRLDEALKDWLLSQAQAEGRSASEILESLLVEYREKVSGVKAPPEAKLVAERDRILREAKKIQDAPENADALNLGGFLIYRPEEDLEKRNLPRGPYADLLPDLEAVKVAAIRDFEAGTGWAEEANKEELRKSKIEVTDIAQILGALNLVEHLRELVKQRDDLLAQLRALYKSQI